MTRPVPSNVRSLSRRRSVRAVPGWITRPVFGVLLAALAVESNLGGPEYFALFVGVGSALGVREWHRMVGTGARSSLPETILGIATIWGLLAALVLRPHEWYAWAILGAGIVATTVLAGVRGERALWQGAGVLYLGLPALALIATRALPPNAALVLIGVFIIVWAADTGALIAGKLIGGPKFAPVLSPNKTWSGTLGGMAAAAALEAGYVGYLGGSAWKAAIYGAALAAVAHAGDLFESFVKRRFHKKDSGTMIPGHGGVLDRIDSMLAASVGLAALVFFAHLDPLFGAQP
jgi:phosphatidate cytidylyltransferase